MTKVDREVSPAVRVVIAGVFVVGMAASVAPGAVAGPLARVLGPATVEDVLRQVVTVAGLLLSLVAGGRLAGQEPVRSWMASRPVLWFLVLFNAAAAVVTVVTVPGFKGLLTFVGLGLVSLGAGRGLVVGRRSVAGPSTARR